MKKEVILFGTGEYAKKYTQILEALSISVLYYVDNNKEKWRTIFCGKEVASPETLMEYPEVPIVISCSYSYEQEIVSQLEKMGVSERVVSIHKIKMSNHKELEKFYNLKKVIFNSSQTVIIDNLEGAWGGIEDWSHDITLMLRKNNIPAFILESMQQTTQRKDLEQFIIRFDRSEQQWIKRHLQLIEYLYLRMPFVLLNNYSMEVMYAASILKYMFPDNVRIITILHCDFLYCYQYHSEWDEYVDKYLCISSRIRQNFCESQRVPLGKVSVRTNIIPYKEIFRKSYTKKEEPIRIAFASRLEREQKRAHLLPEVIDRLEKRNLEYKIDIAGKGECLEYLLDYIKVNHLEDKVRYEGFVPKDEMEAFWQKQDIYLNLSEYEGLSLAMLEAMYSGAIPVVTRVSGVDDMVKNGENGLVYGVDDLEGIVDGIVFLSEHRELLVQFGRAIKNMLVQKCDQQEYVNYFSELLETIWKNKAG